VSEADGNFTQKEMLVRIDGKLDAALARIETVELKQAVHEAQPYHNEATVKQLEARLEELGRKFFTAFGVGLAVIFMLSILGPFIVDKIVGI
jgi:BMFP domain-containing protein YqiC